MNRMMINFCALFTLSRQGKPLFCGRSGDRYFERVSPIHVYGPSSPICNSIGAQEIFPAALFYWVLYGLILLSDLSLQKQSEMKYSDRLWAVSAWTFLSEPCFRHGKRARKRRANSAIPRNTVIKIDWTLLIQAVNFFVLLGILQKLVFKPFLKVMEELLLN